MKYIFSLLLIFAMSTTLFAQTKQVLPLWPNGPKESNGIIVAEVVENQHRILNISEGNITVQLSEAAKATGSAVIICPGGGYMAEAVFHEGYQFADWLNEQGVAAILLKYRLPNGHTEIPLADAKQAIRMVRAHADEWKIAPNKIAIAGFSAGGHLASTLGTHFDLGNPESADPLERYSSRPDMLILFYPVVSMKEGVTHAGSRLNLLGKTPSQEMIDLYSNALQVKENTPPTILMLSDDDGAVPPLNSVEFYLALKAKKIPATMAIFPTGGHGWGMRTNVSFWAEWRAFLLDWFAKNQFLKAKTL